MVQSSVLILQRNAPELVAGQLPRICEVLDRLQGQYEIIVLDDGSTSAALEALKHLLVRFERLRIVRLDRPAGISAALTAGIAAARGDLVIAIEAGDRYPERQIVGLISHLSRADLVFGRPGRSPAAKLWHRIARVPRWALLGLEVRDPDCLFWAARREAIQGIELARGMYRYLPTLVAIRGYRVSEIPIQRRPGRRSAPGGWPNPGDLLATWWLKRRHQTVTAFEIVSQDARNVDPDVLRVDPPHLPDGQTRGVHRVPYSQRHDAA